jgi:hypothetical protein
MTAKLAAELVARCFDARTTTHFAHLATRSYAQHVALGEFYDEIAAKADAFIECYQGVNGHIASYPSIKPEAGCSPLECLPELHKWVVAHRAECAGDDTELANLIDEILSTIDRTFYKLKFLK